MRILKVTDIAQRYGCLRLSEWDIERKSIEISEYPTDKQRELYEEIVQFLILSLTYRYKPKDELMFTFITWGYLEGIWVRLHKDIGVFFYVMPNDKE